MKPHSPILSMGGSFKKDHIDSDSSNHRYREEAFSFSQLNN